MYRSIFLLLLGVLTTTVIAAQPAVHLVPLPQPFQQPTDIVADPQTDVLYILEKEGRVQLLDTTINAASEWLDLTAEVNATGEGGLLGMAFHPNPDSAYVYVNYTASSPTTRSLLTTVARLRVGEDGLPELSSRRIILTVEQPATNHNAGDLAFGPDGYLYIPLGDGGGSYDPFETSQNPRSLLGKLLRIDVNTQEGGSNYAIPEDNPFARFAGESSPDTLPEIWALGLRNPWRISFDRQTGDLWIGDVGQGTREEVDFQPAGSPGGQNYGWNCREGFIPSPRPTERYCGNGAGPFIAPELDYPHSGNDGFSGRSITGGYLYRGPYTALQGYYIFGDFAAPRLFLYQPQSTGAEGVTVLDNIPLNSTSTFGEGRDGSLFVADYGGTIYKINGEGPTAVVGSTPEVTLILYPNPTSGWVAVTLPPSLRTGRVEVYDGGGRRVGEGLAQRQAGDRLELNLESLAPGIYLVRVTDGEVRASGRVVVR